MSTVATAEARPDILKALRSLGGRGTLGDVVSSVGLPRDEVEGTLKSLLESHQGHLEVSESGEVVYLFDRRLIRRDRIPTIERLKSAAKRFLTGAFKAWIVTMLVVYFVVFVVLVVAALVAMMSRGGDRRSGGSWGRGAGRHGGHFHFPSFWLWYYIWTPRWRLGSPYYGRRWEATLEKDSRPPFYKKVFAFVFGPDRPKPTRKQLDRSTLRLIRARRGALTTAELIEHTALGMPEAEEEMGRLLGSYAGEPDVSPDGELVYAFPEIMTSAHGAVTAREPNPAWMRMEYSLELTGNEKKHDAVIIGMNGFTLAAGATAPWFIFPQLGIGGTAAFVGLVLVPVVFSVLFFSVPLLRVLGMRKENRARKARNVRRLVLGLVLPRGARRRPSHHRRGGDRARAGEDEGSDRGSIRGRGGSSSARCRVRCGRVVQRGGAVRSGWVVQGEGSVHRGELPSVLLPGHSQAVPGQRDGAATTQAGGRRNR